MVGNPNIPFFGRGLFHPLILTIDPITSCPGHPSSSHPSFRILFPCHQYQAPRSRVKPSLTSTCHRLSFCKENGTNFPKETNIPTVGAWL